MATAPTRIIMDGHVHIYPGYDVPEAVECLFCNLTANAPAAPPETCTVMIGLLAESRACRFYRDIAQSRTSINSESWRFEAGPDEGSVTIHEHGVIKGFLVAGRQIVTAEKLEVLGLGSDISVNDGLPAEETIRAVRAQGAVPVLSWSPGKWFFARGKRVQSLLETHTPGDFLMGDTGLRPTVWPLPFLMKSAARQGFVIIGGSDALPLPGEECQLGSYGVSCLAQFDPCKPADSLRRILADPATRPIPLGHRSRPLPFLFRWLNNQFSGKKGNVQKGDKPS